MTKIPKLAVTVLLAAALFGVGAVGVFRAQRTDATPVTATRGGTEGTRAATGQLGDSIAALEARVEAVPGDWQAMASLGLAYVQQARVTADPSYYPKAQGILEASLRSHPQDNEGALVGMAALAAARHDFAAALRFGLRARRVNPYDGNVYGVIGDAQVELGRYDEAFETFQRMVDTEPGVASYARVSYAREIRGDVAGAIEAMTAAREIAGTRADEAWASFQLGELWWNSGRVARAAQAYRFGVQADPDYVPNLAGLAKIAWARGDLDAAIAGYEEVVRRFPSPEHVTALGDLYALVGQEDAAQRQYDLVRAEADLFRAAGVDTDLELALFDADHGSPRTALRAARAEWDRRHSIHVADALAWALHANGNDTEAATYADRALALGTRNALFVYHAGMIRLGLGDRAGARELLAEALRINPRFSILYSAEASSTLRRLGGAA
ncbi:MAG: tetratricopeptide repeat protein [Actinomycetota bacterium]